MSIAKKVGKKGKIFNLVENKQYLIYCSILNIRVKSLCLIGCVMSVTICKSSSP
jgi:uncharacterized protein (DUF2147 family)